MKTEVIHQKVERRPIAEEGREAVATFSGVGVTFKVWIDPVDIKTWGVYLTAQSGGSADMIIDAWMGYGAEPWQAQFATYTAVKKLITADLRENS